MLLGYSDNESSMTEGVINNDYIKLLLLWNVARTVLMKF